jgi:uncharacterized protein (TIGR00251 family)
MSQAWCCTSARGIRITVQITPNARRTEVTGMLDDALKIRLQAQPVEGKANEALVRYLADRLDVPKSHVSVMHGHTGKRKIIDIAGTVLNVEQVERILLGPSM